MTDKPTLLIDSHYIGHQAHYTLGELSHDDVATGVMFGFLSRVLSLGLQFQTNDIMFCWDSKESYRRRKYPWYKSHRRELKPEEQRSLSVMHEQLNTLRTEILPGIGFVNQFIQKGCESDDIMAKIVDWKLGEWIIVTADEDLYQCMKMNTRVYNPSKKKMMSARRLKEEYGVGPEKWAAAKAIAGCSSDSVPGIPGVGMKTAIKYLTGDLKDTYKTHQSICANPDIIKRNLPIVTLPITKTREPVLRPNVFNREAFEELCEKYGLVSFLVGPNLESWEALFSGNITESTTNVYHHKVKTRPPRRKRAKDKTTDQPGLLDGM